MAYVPDRRRSNDFGYPLHLKLLVIAAAVTTIGLTSTAVAAQRRLFDVDGLLTVALLMLPQALACLYVCRTSVTLTNEGVGYRGVLISRLIRWDEIDDLHSSVRLLVLSTGSHIKLRLFRGDYGLAIKPFEVLQRKLSDRLQPRLTERWSRVKLPRRYPYPGLSLGVLLV